jgi:hypothetical protein
MDEFYGRKVYTLDDSSGVCIECTCPAPLPPKSATLPPAAPLTVIVTKNEPAEQKTEGPTVTNPKIPWDEVDVGVVVKIKGGIRDFRGERQVEIIKVEVLKSTDQEVRCWDEVLAFRREILSVPWVVSAEMEEKYKRRAMREKRHEKKGKTEDGKQKRSVGSRVDDGKRQKRTEDSRGKSDMRQKRSASDQDGQSERRQATKTEDRDGKPEKEKRTVDDRNAALNEVNEGLGRERKDQERRERHENKAKRRKDGDGDGFDPANKANYPSLAVRRRAAGKYDALGI